MTETRYTDYDRFAWLYNTYWSKRLIDQIYWTIEKYLLDKLDPGSRILDVCCGNGHLSGLMCGRGFAVTGIDGSEEMLRFARENAPQAVFQAADARDFHFDEPFDAVVSTCDSFNHIMDIEELSQTFANAYAALKPGGHFLFDLNTEEGYVKYWKGQSGGRAKDDHAFILTLNYDEQEKTSSFDITHFYLDDGAWQRCDFGLTQRFYPIDVIRPRLEKAGFVDIEVYDTEKDFGIHGTGRVMYVMKKG